MDLKLVYMVGFVIGLVISSVIASMMGQAPMESGLKDVEGFQGSEDSLDKLNEKITAKITDLNNKLRVGEYKNTYTEIKTKTKDLMESSKLVSIFVFKNMNPDKEKDLTKFVTEGGKLAESLASLDAGIKSVDAIDLNAA